MSANGPRYPELSRLIEKGLEDARRAGRRYTVREARETINRLGSKISVATFAAWKGGHRAPRKENLQSIGQLFYPDDADKRSEFITRLERASSPPNEQEDTLENPQVGAIEYGPISHPGMPGQGFLDDFMRRLLLYGDLNAKDEFSNAALDQATESLELGEFDILAGVMATVDRNKKLRFFSTPISFPVNAVALKEHINKIAPTGGSEKERVAIARERLRVALTTLPTKDTQKQQQYIAHPIVRPDEVGELYCRLALNLDTRETSKGVTLVKHYRAEDYLSALKNQDPRPDRFPVVVVDELMCLQIAEKEKSCTLVFDINDAQARMPRYSVGWAVARRRKNLIAYLEEAFPIYLRADGNFLRERYKKLYRDLRDQAEDALGKGHDAEITKWAKCAIGLDADTSDFGYGPGWQTLLKRVGSDLQNE